VRFRAGTALACPQNTPASPKVTPNFDERVSRRIGGAGGHPAEDGGGKAAAHRLAGHFTRAHAIGSKSADPPPYGRTVCRRRPVGVSTWQARRRGVSASPPVASLVCRAATHSMKQAFGGLPPAPSGRQPRRSRSAHSAAPTIPASLRNSAGTILTRGFTYLKNFACFALTPPPMTISSGQRIFSRMSM